MKYNHKNRLYKKDIEDGLQMADFYLFTPRFPFAALWALALGLRFASTFVFYLLHE